MNSPQKNFANILGKLILFAFESNIKVKIYYLGRTAEEQKELFDQGKSNCDGYSKVSKHQQMLACDLAIIKDGQIIWEMCPEYEILGNWWRTNGGKWGKDFIDKKTGKPLNDFYHFEL